MTQTPTQSNSTRINSYARAAWADIEAAEAAALQDGAARIDLGFTVGHYDNPYEALLVERRDAGGYKYALRYFKAPEWGQMKGRTQRSVDRIGAINELADLRETVAIRTAAAPAAKPHREPSEAARQVIDMVASE